MARLLAAELHRRLGQPAIAENKPGVGGALGSDQVAMAAPDGYTLVMGNIGSHAMNVGVYPRLPYDPVRDFEPVAMVAITPSLMTVSSDLAVRSLREFLDHARGAADKGEQIRVASGGNGSSSHLAGEYLNLLTGLKQALAKPALRERIQPFGAEPMVMTTSQLKAFVASEVAKWSMVARETGARAD